MSKRKYFVYSNVTLKDRKGIIPTITFENVPAAGEWLAEHCYAATVNAARTGVYYLLEARMNHYGRFVLESYDAYPINF